MAYQIALQHLLLLIDAHDPAPDQTAYQLALLKRHAASVLTVTAQLVSRHSRDLVSGAIPENSLIRLVVGGAPATVADNLRALGLELDITPPL